MAKTWFIQFVDPREGRLVEERDTIWDAETRAIELIQNEYAVDPVVRFPDDDGVVFLEISTKHGWKPVATVHEESI